MFEKASRMKLRFDTTLGNILVEDLWDLPLTGPDNTATLDSIAKSLNKRIKNVEEESFVVARVAAQTDDVIGLELVKHIISVRLKEIEEKQSAKANKEKRDMILKAISEKEADSLKNMSVDDLKNMVKEL